MSAVRYVRLVGNVLTYRTRAEVLRNMPLGAPTVDVLDGIDRLPHTLALTARLFRARKEGVPCRTS